MQPLTPSASSAPPATDADSLPLKQSAGPSAEQLALDEELEPVAARYRERERFHKAQESRLQRRHVQLGWLRLACGVLFVLLVFRAPRVCVVALLAFAMAARVHGKVLAQLAASRRAITFYQRCLARLRGDRTGEAQRTPDEDTTHSLFAADLDLFGPSSLFDLLCEARTSLGERTLAQWLLYPAPPQSVLERQRAVAALRDQLLLREAFAAAPGPALVPLPEGSLASWGEAPADPLPSVLAWVAPVLVLCILLAAAWYATGHSALPLAALLLTAFSLTFAYRRSFQSIFVQAEKTSRALGAAAALLAAVEAASFTEDSLRTLQTTLLHGEAHASAAIARLSALCTWAEARSNYVVRVLDAPFLYSLQLALALHRWRAHFGPQLRPWLATLGTLDALLSLAGFSLEHPSYATPHFHTEAPLFRAHALGHPLLPRATCVRNDVQLDTATRLLLVSGSNMSGKSTLLRSVGINAVLAFAGAPVCASSLTLSPLCLAASIHVQDSLHAGRSRFFAEILRLRQIAEAATARGPVLYLIDEVLAGTNSRDRLAGAQGLVHALLRAGALGLLSTHDLALTDLGEDGSLAVRNVHFEDEVLGGELRFDYRLREGVVERSNGLALMRLIGLDV